MVLSYTEDEFAYIIADIDGNYGDGESNVYGTYGDRHRFINGEDLGLNIVQGGNLLFGNSHKEGLWNSTSLAGGARNTGSQSCSFIGAGTENNISGSGNKSFIGAGVANSIQTSANQGNAIVAGTQNLINDAGTGAGNNFIGAGLGNKVGTGGCSGIVTGYNNCITAAQSFIGGGSSNQAISSYSTVAGGQSNCARNSYAFVGAGYSNDAAGYASAIGGGYNNSAMGGCSTVGGGKNNCTVPSYSSVLGGYCNIIYTNGPCVTYHIVIKIKKFRIISETESKYRPV